MSESYGNETIDQPDERDDGGDEPKQIGRLEERERRRQATQQHGDTFAVDEEEPSDAEGGRHGAGNRVTALPGDDEHGEG